MERRFVDDASLEAVADAIRTKSWGRKMKFPEGFVSQVQKLAALPCPHINVDTFATECEMLTGSISFQTSGYPGGGVSVSEAGNLMCVKSGQDAVIYNTTGEMVQTPMIAAYMFWRFPCAQLSLRNLDTFNTQSMQLMFYRMQNVQELDLIGLDTSNTVNMISMFDSCGAKTIKLTGLDTSKVGNMSKMFNGCAATALDLLSFDTSSVTDMSNMFKSCKNLSELDLSSFDTHKVTRMGYMFSACSATRVKCKSEYDMNRFKAEGNPPETMVFYT